MPRFLITSQNSPTATPTKELAVTKQIELHLKRMSSTTADVLRFLNQLITQNNSFRKKDEAGRPAISPDGKPVFDPEAVEAAFSSNTTTGYTGQDLRDAQKIGRAVSLWLNEGSTTTEGEVAYISVAVDASKLTAEDRAEIDALIQAKAASHS